jgi:hypothetical protein
MYFGAASRRACGRAVAANARAGAPALGCICLTVQSPLRTHRCAHHACGCVFRACAVSFHGFGPFDPTSAHRCAAWPHGWRAGARPTPSSRRCRRRPTGRTSRHCECPRRRAHAAAPMRRRGVGRVVSARAPDVHDWVHVCACICVYAAVHACVCVHMRACAECIPAWASACAGAGAC